MVLTDPERSLIEHALDSMAVAMHGDATERHKALMAYERAINLVREKPAGTWRRVRADFNRQRKNAAQLELGA